MGKGDVNLTKLYELANQYRILMEMADAEIENNEDLDQDTIQMYIDTLEAIEDSIEHKVENIIKFLKNLESDINAFRAEEMRLQRKRKSLERKVERLKEYTKQMLEVAGFNKLNAGVFKVRLQKNPPSVMILDESKIPSEYRIPQPDKIDKQKILQDIKNGKMVDGAQLSPETRHLRYD